MYDLREWDDVTDLCRGLYVYVNDIQVTGGVKEAAFDVPVAWDLLKGHAFQVYNGDINQENGATLAVKYLWDNDAVALIENYTRPYLGKGDFSVPAAANTNSQLSHTPPTFQYAAA
jgi:hypothetical protein